MPAGSYKFSPVHSSVRTGTFLRIHSLFFSETGTGCPWFLDKNPYLVILAQNGSKMAQNRSLRPYLEISSLLLASICAKSCFVRLQIRFRHSFSQENSVFSLFFVAKNGLGQSNRSILKSLYLRNHWSDLADFYGIFCLFVALNAKISH